VSVFECTIKSQYYLFSEILLISWDKKTGLTSLYRLFAAFCMLMCSQSCYNCGQSMCCKLNGWFMWRWAHLLQHVVNRWNCRCTDVPTCLCWSLGTASVLFVTDVCRLIVEVLSQSHSLSSQVSVTFFYIFAYFIIPGTWLVLRSTWGLQLESGSPIYVHTCSRNLLCVSASSIWMDSNTGHCLV